MLPVLFRFFRKNTTQNTPRYPNFKKQLRTGKGFRGYYYTLFKNCGKQEGIDYVEQGVSKYEQQLKEKQWRYLEKMATQYGFKLVSNPIAT